jgi:ubiquinone/menaquinone biosynthesis C-methylase UbiE
MRSSWSEEAGGVLGGGPGAGLSASDANRLYYASRAADYDQSEECVTLERHQNRLRRVLGTAIAAAAALDRVLDACGGSGYASLELGSMGVDVVTVDVSPEMLELYEKKASEAGLRSTTRVGEIGSFLSSSSEEWDLVVFSSALHHLEDYQAILDAVCGRLAAGGVIATVFDPISSGKLVQAIRYIDYLAWLAVRQPLSFLRKLSQRAARPSAGTPSIGRLAERHALTGIDDAALARHFEANGLEIVLHERSYEARFAAMRGVLRLLASPTAFAFVVRRVA